MKTVIFHCDRGNHSEITVMYKTATATHKYCHVCITTWTPCHSRIISKFRYLHLEKETRRQTINPRRKQRRTLYASSCSHITSHFFLALSKSLLYVLAPAAPPSERFYISVCACGGKQTPLLSLDGKCIVVPVVTVDEEGPL